MQEAPFVLSDLALEVLGDFSLVWLLSPKVSFKTPSTGIGSVISKLPGHCFQVRNFCLLCLAKEVLAILTNKILPADYMMCKDTEGRKVISFFCYIE